MRKTSVEQAEFLRNTADLGSPNDLEHRIVTKITVMLAISPDNDQNPLRILIDSIVKRLGIDTDIYRRVRSVKKNIKVVEHDKIIPQLVGKPERNVLAGNIPNTYYRVGPTEQARQVGRAVGVGQKPEVIP